MRYGSCLAIFRDTNCISANGHITSVGVCYPAEIYGARLCTKTDTILRCAPGQVVKAMEISGNSVSEGISIHCYTPEATVFSSPNEIFHLNNSTMTKGVRTECENGIQGLINQLDEDREVVEATTLLCQSDQSPSGHWSRGRCRGWCYGFN